MIKRTARKSETVADCPACGRREIVSEGSELVACWRCAMDTDVKKCNTEKRKAVRGRN